MGTRRMCGWECYRCTLFLCKNVSLALTCWNKQGLVRFIICLTIASVALYYQGHLGFTSAFMFSSFLNLIVRVI